MHRVESGQYLTEHFEITREIRKRNGPWWIVRPLTSAAEAIRITRKHPSLEDAKKAVEAYDVFVHAWICAHRPTIKRARLATILMVAGEEKRTTTVIDHGNRMQWVGFGWVNEGAASEADYATYPSVIN